MAFVFDADELGSWSVGNKYLKQTKPLSKSAASFRGCEALWGIVQVSGSLWGTKLYKRVCLDPTSIRKKGKTLRWLRWS